MENSQGISLSSTEFALKEDVLMNRYRCTICGYVYDPEKGDPENGVKPGTRFEDLLDDWVCPLCGAEKAMFEKED
jgi:rubredoxin